MPYHHITKEERIEISALKNAEHTNGEIAKQIGCDRSNIGRELRRNVTEIYFETFRYIPGKANKKTKQRRTEANQQRKKIVHGSELAKYVEKKIKKYWSPEQISGRRKDEKKSPISYETIYQYIYKEKKELIPYLRYKKSKYRRRHGTKDRESRREDKKKRKIEERPKVVETRTRIGDWEGDTVIGKEKTKRILTHVERKSGKLIANKVDTVTAEKVSEKTVSSFKKVPKKKRHTITYDRGSEFAGHDTTERKLDIDIYFANAYRSWERGTNENTNGLLRQFFPKRMYFENLTEKKLQWAVRLLNNRPRKRLGYKTPQEIFNA